MRVLTQTQKALGILAIAGVIVFLSLSNHFLLKKNPNSCSQPMAQFLSHPASQIFSFEYQNHSASDWSAVFTSEKSKGGIQQDVQIKLTADWWMTVIAQSDHEYVILNELKNTQISLLHNQLADPNRNKEILAEISKKFYFKMNKNGEVLAIQADKKLHVVEKNILRWLVSHVQTVFPVQGAGSGVPREWVANEYDPNGLYESSYRISSAPVQSSVGSSQGSDDGFHLEKIKSKYLVLNSVRKQKSKIRRSEFDVALKMDTQSTGSGDFDCTRGVFTSLGGNEKTETSVSGNAIAHSEDQFRMEFKRESPVSDSDRASLNAQYLAMDSDRSSFGIVASETSQDMEKLLQKNELGDLTEGKLISLLNQARNSKDPQAISALYLKFKALVYLYPESSAKLGEILATEDPSSKVMGMLATVLSTVGHEQAQSALVSALTARSDNSAAVHLLVPALGMTDHPTQASEEALKSLVQNSDQEDIVSTAGLSLGVMASRLADDAPDREKQIVEGVQHDYENARTQPQKKLLVSILGNAGSRTSLPILFEALNSSDSSLQEEAVMALRFVSGNDVEDKLFQVLRENPNESVKKAAVAALGYRDVNVDLSQRLRAEFSSQKSEWIRRDIVKASYEFRSVDPGLVTWLKTVNETDPSKDVRQIAGDYYARSGKMETRN